MLINPTVKKRIDENIAKAANAAVESKMKQDMRKAEKAKKGQVISEAEAEGVKFIHIRPIDELLNEHPFKTVKLKGGATIALKPHGPKGSRLNFYEVSVAYCSDHDNFNKFEGRYRSSVEFIEGRRIKMRVPADLNPQVIIGTTLGSIIQ